MMKRGTIVDPILITVELVKVMLKPYVLISGPTISADEELINALEKTTVVLREKDNRKIQTFLENKKIDMILLEPSGEQSQKIEIIKNIKHQFHDVKIILINGDRELFVKAFSFGVKDAFHKPYRRQMLVERVSALLA